MNPIQLTGQTFGRLTVIAAAPKLRGRMALRWLCQCACGSKSIVAGTALRGDEIKSCGCLRKEKATKHGMYRTKEHVAWCNMKQRCLNPNSQRWKNYGGRGIGVCKEWESFTAFIQDMGRCPPGLTLERIDNDLGYFMGNCRWATKIDQGKNKRKTEERDVIEKILKRKLKNGEKVVKISDHYIACENWFYEFLRNRMNTQLRRKSKEVSL